MNNCIEAAFEEYYDSVGIFKSRRVSAAAAVWPWPAGLGIVWQLSLTG